MPIEEGEEDKRTISALTITIFALTITIDALTIIISERDQHLSAIIIYSLYCYNSTEHLCQSPYFPGLFTRRC